MSTAQAALDMLSSDIASRKAEAGAKLTPTASELASAPPADDRAEWQPPVVTAAEVGEVLDQFKVADRAHANAVRALTNLYWKLKAEAPPDTSNMEADYFAAKQAEGTAEADGVAIAKEVFGEDAFVADFEAKSKAAQAATFRSTSEPVQPVVEHWVCPEHGEAVEAVSPKGRAYWKCPSCKQFEKGT